LVEKASRRDPIRRQTVSVVRSLALRSRVLSLAKDLFDRVEVGAVGRQEQELGAGGSDRAADGEALVAAKVVHDDDVARAQGWDEELLHPGEEALAVDRPVEDAGRVDAVVTKGSDEGEGAPAAVRVMLVLAQVSSMKTRRRGSSRP
jgi:hypothetical protein